MPINYDNLTDEQKTEISILGGLLLDSCQIDEVRAIIMPEYFSVRHGELLMK